MKKTIVLFCTLFLYYFPSSAQKRPSEVGYVDNGKCSYYVNDRGGALTRSGEKFNKNALEGGHTLIPFGSLVRVTNLDNKKSVIIRINDRPNSNRRILDVTHKVAEKLGLISDSVASAYVQVVVLKLNVARSKNNHHIAPTTITNTQTVLPTSKNIQSAKTTSQAMIENFKQINLYMPDGKVLDLKGYTIQVSGFSEVEKSILVAKQMTSKYNRQFYIQSGWSKGAKYYRVVTGEYADKKSAEKSLALLKNRGITGFVRPHFKKS